MQRRVLEGLGVLMLCLSQRIGLRNLLVSISNLCFTTTLALAKARMTQLLAVVGRHEESMLSLIAILVVGIGIDTSCISCSGLC